MLHIDLLRFIGEYKLYIENYPFAEAQHLSEYRKNTRYRSFIAQCSQDPRMKKREFNSLLIRPVTHLPRIQLLLETMRKHTNPEHEDQASIPIASGVLSEFIKSTERGIENAREKVKYWALCESLVFTHGEGMVCDPLIQYMRLFSFLFSREDFYLFFGRSSSRCWICTMNIGLCIVPDGLEGRQIGRLGLRGGTYMSHYSIITVSPPQTILVSIFMLLMKCSPSVEAR